MLYKTLFEIKKNEVDELTKPKVHLRYKIGIRIRYKNVRTLALFPLLV